jgi:hypothetical protein
MMQLSLFAFCLGGSALSLAYYDVFFILVGLALALRIYVANVRTELTSKSEEAGRERSPAKRNFLRGPGPIGRPLGAS